VTSWSLGTGVIGVVAAFLTSAHWASANQREASEIILTSTLAALSASPACAALGLGLLSLGYGKRNWKSVLGTALGVFALIVLTRLYRDIIN
jgi:hypothetical protein